ncbi:general stress protein [Cryobacterium tagatosivorans]|jgi:hypothetical protein|uniref:General stress protein 17M-like domain-containing protein n=1 Tax=Cryobacterium tagatosivorans TaxID=1259199 RepID=A0A4V3I6H4_9MICO|nr:general stress protein [Cryobacterium tagatosivorans]TFB51269.1 hypothetical protein E3O23_08955 [Cryobacterium tagatosivorans]
MSNQSPWSSRAAVLFPVLPKGEVLATFETYNEAQQAVEKLAVSDFPVKQLSIVGNDLKSVERVTGKLTYGRVALAGAASGAWMGIFFGVLFFIFAPTSSSLPFVAAALLIGAGFGMFFGLVSYALNRRRRDFTSTMQVIASNYQVIVEPGLVHRARNLLAGVPEAAAPAAPPHVAEPPRAAEPPVPGTEPPTGSPAAPPVQPPAPGSERPRYGVQSPAPAPGAEPSAQPPAPPAP